MKVHGCTGRSPPHYDSDGEESNSSSAGSISVAASPHVNGTSGGGGGGGNNHPSNGHHVPGATTLSEWYVACQPPSTAPDPLGGLGPFGNLHHSGAATAY